MDAELTVIIVSYNTKDLTLKALETLYANTHQTRFHTVVWDNDSRDGSADAVAERFPHVELVRSADNVGFAAANNRVAETLKTEWMLLLNPDTETHDGAIDALLAFAKANPTAGITGGRTVFPDGSLNRASCWRKITPWSLLCAATGLTAAFPNSDLFNPEGMGAWARDSVREVDIVVGCLLMIRTELWRDLGGFNERYFMYGEEADLCLRAAKMGYQPMITPDAEIMHLVGASSNKRAEKSVLVAKARTTLVRDHWPSGQVPLGIALMWFWGASRTAASRLLSLLPGEAHKKRLETWRHIWSRRDDWLKGY